MPRKHPPEYWDSFIGKSFGSWRVIGYESVPDNNNPNRFITRLRCVCSCGSKKLLRPDQFLKGCSKSCRECQYKGYQKPYRDTNAYRSWRTMKARCDNPNNKQFHNYGGRGVTYCDRWKSFENFFGDMGERPFGWHLDKDKKGGIGCKLYCLENCSWLSPNENPKYSRKKYKGSTMLSEDQCIRIVELYKQGHSIHSIRKTTGNGKSAIKRVLTLYSLL